MKDEIILYRPDELAEHIEVRIDEKAETIWLTQQQIAELFGTQRPAITKHLGNIFKSGELDENVVSSILEHTTPHGAIKGKTQNVKVKYYNIDAVLSVGYRVNSVRATQFRIWATRVLKDYLLKGYAINTRMNRIEDNVQALTDKVNQIDLQINTHLIPNQGVFFDGQVFDAYELASKRNWLSKLITFKSQVASTSSPPKPTPKKQPHTAPPITNNSPEKLHLST
jgi:hypothetical protein